MAKDSDSQENFVSLHKETKEINAYGTNDHKGAEGAVTEDDAEQRHERLGLRAYQENGKPTLGCRWDTLLYEEGLRPDLAGDSLGGARLAVRQESDRLITTAKRVGDYIPSTIWETFGDRVNKPSGESIVFTDEKHGRVIKFKDPFAYVSLKDDNPYTALYEHHIHNHFFGDVGYRFLGVSQDPVSGTARFAFEQPFIECEEHPSDKEIKDWFEKRGFHQTKDGFWFTDGYVSFTDVWADNCLKGQDGTLHFIDPIIKFDREPKEVLSHYIEQQQEQEEELDLSYLDDEEEEQGQSRGLHF